MRDAGRGMRDAGCGMRKGAFRIPHCHARQYYDPPFFGTRFSGAGRVGGFGIFAIRS